MNNFDFQLLGEFRNKMYESLLYKDDLTKPTAREIQWKNSRLANVKGFTFKKDNVLYLLDMNLFDKLPIRVVKTDQRITVNGDIVEYITKLKSFNVIPEQVMTFRNLISVDIIKHSSPLDWMLWKIVVWTARISRVNARVSSKREFGKTSYINVVHHLVDKAYVTPQPKSKPGIFIYVTNDGLVAYDEMGKIKSEIKQEIGSTLFQFGDMSNILSLGTAGSAAHNTKARIPIENCSCICLYNRLQDYQEEKDFFDFMFSNKSAINNRFLPLKPTGGAIDINQFLKKGTLTPEIEKLYIGIMKTFEYYNQNWKRMVDYDLVDGQLKQYTSVTGRQRISLRNIMCFIQLWSDGNAEEFKCMCDRLMSWNKNYMDMVGQNENQYKNGVLTEDVK